MRPPTFVRSLTDEERQALKAGLRSPNAFALRRCQALLQSADGRRPSETAVAVGCCVQSVRNAIRAFHADGLGCLREKSSRPKTVHAVIDDPARRKLRDMLHRSPATSASPPASGPWSWSPRSHTPRA